MNTSKQVNIMVVLIFLTLIALGIYTLVDPARQQNAKANQLDLLASRGAAEFAQYCRPCHGDIGQGRIGPPLNPVYRKQVGRSNLTDPAALTENQLFVTNTITCGRVGTLMPTWGQAQGGPLSDEQIRNLVALITQDPNDAWNTYVKPDSAAANAIATPPAVADLLQGSITGQKDSVCGQSTAGPAGAAAAAPVATGAAAVQATPAPSTSLTETTTDNKYSDTVFTIPAGQPVTITVTNKGQALHNFHVLNVQGADGKPVQTALVNPGSSTKFTFTITKPGTYQFHCDVHPTQMIGTLNVVGSTAAAATAAASVVANNAATAAPASGAQPNPSTGTGIGTPAPSATPSEGNVAFPSPSVKPAPTKTATPTAVPTATPTPTPSGPVSLTETTTDNKFSTTSFTVNAGQQVTMTVKNDGQALHNWHVLNVKSTDGKDIVPTPLLVPPGQTATVTFTISTPGTYKFQCDVHPTQMFGTLIVK